MNKTLTERYLLGGFTCELTLDELNQWSLLVYSRGEFILHQIIRHQLEHCPYANIDELVRKRIKVEERIWKLSKGWYATIVKARKPKKT